MGAPVAEVLRQERVCLGAGSAGAWTDITPELGQGPRGLGAWTQVEDSEGRSESDALHSRNDHTCNGATAFSGGRVVTRAFPSGGRVTLGRSFPLLRLWFSPVGWHKGAARCSPNA